LYFLANDKLSPFAFDGPKIQRIVSNLLENASKYTPQGGTVWLHAEPHMWERRGVSKPGANGDRRRQATNIPNAVKVSVSDTGPGIRPEFHLEIFDDFFRLPGSESAEGMGLGLAISRRLLQGMGGKIWSKANRSGLQVFFHYSPETNFDHAATRNEMSEAANILLVDDEPGMLRYIRTLLEVDEHKVQTASTAKKPSSTFAKGCNRIWCCSICSCPASMACRLSNNSAT